MINQDVYIRNVVDQHTPHVLNDVWNRISLLAPHINAWANGYKYEIKLSGSLAKGTSITGTTDIDIFISLDPAVSQYNTLENVYFTLRNRLQGSGYETREQNVSLGIDHTGLKVDVVAGVKHHPLGFDHSIWKRKARTWTKTNINGHINHVSKSGRVFDIRAIKIWRKLRDLEFPSFYLELSVIEALKGKTLLSRPSDNFVCVMNYLATEFLDKSIIDPYNQSNEISEELTKIEKQKIKSAADETLKGQWIEALW